MARRYAAPSVGQPGELPGRAAPGDYLQRQLHVPGQGRAQRRRLDRGPRPRLHHRPGRVLSPDNGGCVEVAAAVRAHRPCPGGGRWFGERGDARGGVVGCVHGGLLEGRGAGRPVPRRRYLGETTMALLTAPPSQEGVATPELMTA